MSNSFDFELVASDQATEAIERINEAIRDLEPKLDKTKEGLQLGGQETLDGLNGFISRFENLSKNARDNVQYIGDMVPPLKMVGELSGKLASLGVVGAAGYGLKQIAYGFHEASREAYNLDVAAKNAGMRVDDFSRLSGTMRILGADGDSANSSIEGMAKSLKEAASGANSQVLGALSQIGVQIQKNNDGSVDTLRTLESIARVFPSLRPDQQKSVSDALGLTPEMLALMREGVRMKALLAKSDELGLTVDPELNRQLSEVNGSMNELGAAWDGLKNRSKNSLFKGLLSDGSVKDGLEGVTDLFTNGDFTGLSHALGFISSKDAWKLRRMQGDKALYNTLSRRERGAVDAGFMTDAVRKRYDAQYGAGDRAEQLRNDLSVILPAGAAAPRREVNYSQPSNQALGLRNNNPGNLRIAPNATGVNRGFVTYDNSSDGMAAMARQLMLYGDRGNNTLNSMIHTYAPRSENDTQSYINSVSAATGIQPQQRVDLHNPEVLKSVMAAMIQHENGAQPYSEDEIRAAIQTAISDPRWSGLRDSRVLSQQRENILVPQPDKFDSSSILTASGNGRDTVSENLTRSLKEAMADQKMKLEITLVNDKGEKKTYNVEDNGRITTAMNY
ncbi:hypothetical protein PKG45_15655 [Escherichia coli]|uniref:hypothetical protein n=1 Tax=Escherichia coli TaxID=562 RepID=UPI0021B2AD18|nr:hypothetical protein [Escherichia coli]MCT7459374.1 hypothetical protein [Escherichia coli]